MEEIRDELKEIYKQMEFHLEKEKELLERKNNLQSSLRQMIKKQITELEKKERDIHLEIQIISKDLLDQIQIKTKDLVDEKTSIRNEINRLYHELDPFDY